MKKHAVHMSAYACFCLIMLVGQGVGQARADSLPTGSLNVAALKMRSHDTSLDRRALLREKLAALAANETERPPDLVVVPEYTFYKGYTDHPVHIEPDGYGYFRVVSSGSETSDEIVAAVEETQAWAQSNAVHVMLGTVAERVDRHFEEYPWWEPYTVYNTLLVIDRDGRIAGYRRKACMDIVPSGGTIGDEKDWALQTVRTFGLTTRSGMPFTVFPVICDDYQDYDMLERAAGLQADLIVNSESVSWNGDVFEAAMLAVQNGAWTPYTEGWRRGVRHSYIREYAIKRGVVKTGGWLVKANSIPGAEDPSAGIMELNVPPAPLETLTVTDDYVAGTLSFRQEVDFGNTAPVIESGPESGGIAQTNEPLALAAAAYDPDGGPLPLHAAWSKVAGPGAVAFEPNQSTNAWETSATFSETGCYILQVEATDGLDETVALFTVQVEDPENPLNLAPVAYAGPDREIVFGEPLVLTAMVFDDGRPDPPGSVSVTWSASDPRVNIASPNQLSTSVSFSESSSFGYGISLKVNDGELETWAGSVWVRVHPPPPEPDAEPPLVAVTNPAPGAVLSGVVSVGAEASDNVGVDGLQFLLDGRPLGGEFYGYDPFDMLWDTRLLVPGDYALAAAARDAAGNRTVSEPVAVQVQATDRDGDGLPDWWEHLYFGGPTNAVATALVANGINTALECYIVGIDPTDPESRFAIENVAAEADGFAIRFDTVQGRRYTVEFADRLADPVNWEILTNQMPGSGHSVAVHDMFAPEIGTRFYRVKAGLE